MHCRETWRALAVGHARLPKQTRQARRLKGTSLRVLDSRRTSTARDPLGGAQAGERLRLQFVPTTCALLLPLPSTSPHVVACDPTASSSGAMSLLAAATIAGHTTTEHVQSPQRPNAHEPNQRVEGWGKDLISWHNSLTSLRLQRSALHGALRAFDPHAMPALLPHTHKCRRLKKMRHGMDAWMSLTGAIT
jgi:hypothetical protein